MYFCGQNWQTLVFWRKIFHFNQTFADVEGNKGSYFLDTIWQFWPLCTSFIQPRFLFRRDAKFKPFLEIGTVRRALIGAYHSGCFPKLFMPHAILESDSRRLFQCNTHWEFCPKFLSNCPNQFKIFWMQIVTNTTWFINHKPIRLKFGFILNIMKEIWCTVFWQNSPEMTTK